MLENIKLLLGISDNSKDGLITYLINITQQKVLNYCGMPELPAELENVVVELVIQRYNQIGSEGLQSESYSGIRQDWLNDFTPEIKAQLSRYRKVKFL